MIQYMQDLICLLISRVKDLEDFCGRCCASFLTLCQPIKSFDLRGRKWVGPGFAARAGLDQNMTNQVIVFNQYTVSVLNSNMYIF